MTPRERKEALELVWTLLCQGTAAAFWLAVLVCLIVGSV